MAWAWVGAAHLPRGLGPISAQTKEAGAKSYNNDEATPRPYIGRHDLVSRVGDSLLNRKDVLKPARSSMHIF